MLAITTVLCYYICVARIQNERIYHAKENGTQPGNRAPIPGRENLQRNRRYLWNHLPTGARHPETSRGNFAPGSFYVIGGTMLETGAVVDTPRGRGIVAGRLNDGRIVVKLDVEIERPDYIITAWAFDEAELKVALISWGSKEI
jgi:hypothetical protein